MNTTATKPTLRLREDLTIELHRAFTTCPVIFTHSHDDNLVVLGEMMGGLARLVAQPRSVEHRLLSIAAFAMKWSRAALGALNTESEASFRFSLGAVQTERQRQRELFAAGKLSFDCASPIVDGRRKYRVLLEEVGEVAEAVDQLEAKPDWNRAGHLATELVQVAAVAVAWLEAIIAQEAQAA